jgi:LuxR family transcriptional regulator of csgAB operon
MANSDVTKHDEGLNSSTNRFIYIVGSGKLQNELMAFFLDQLTEMKCLTGEDLHSSEGQSNLVLLDCQGKSLERLLGELEACGPELLSRVFVALFNVDPRLRIEQEALVRGARGFFYFYEQDSLDRFPKGIDTILDGELWVSREIMCKCILKQKRLGSFPNRDTTGLTPRETEILAMVAVGAKNEEIETRRLPRNSVSALTQLRPTSITFSRRLMFPTACRLPSGPRIIYST